MIYIKIIESKEMESKKMELAHATRWVEPPTPAELAIFRIDKIPNMSKVIELCQIDIDLNNLNANTLYLCCIKGEENYVTNPRVMGLKVRKSNELFQEALISLKQNSESGEKDISKAIELFQKAADLNNRKAIKRMAYYYAKGEGVEQDILKAIDLFAGLGMKEVANKLCKCNFNIVNMYDEEKQINNNLIEEYISLIKELEWKNNNNNITVPNNPKEINLDNKRKNYFYGTLALKKENEKLKEINGRMRTAIQFLSVKMEIEYRPGGSGYEKAKEEFESFI